MSDASTLNITQIKQRTIRGLSLLVAREGVIKVIAIIGQLILVRLLVPEYFGIIAIVSFLMDTSDLFSDVGLVSGVIRSKNRLSNDILSSLFWVKMGMEMVLALGLVLARPFFERMLPAMQSVNSALFLIFVITLLVRPLRSMIYGLLERELRYDVIPIIDITGLLIYFSVAIFCAVTGMGIWSLVWSVVIKDICEIVLLEIFHTFIPRLHFSWSDIKPFLRFGLAVQGNTILGFLQQSTIPLFGGMLVSSGAIGLLDWSSNIASLPRALTDNVGRISFASFSRIQEKTALLMRAIEESLSLLSICVLFFITTSLFFGKDAILYVIGPAWLPAAPALTWILLSEFFLGIVGVLQQAIIVRGKTLQLVGFAFTGLLLQWACVVFFVHLFGFIGIAQGICVGMMMRALVCFVLVRRVGIHISLRYIFTPIVWIAICTGGVGWAMTFLPHSFVWLLLKGALFSSFFIMCSYVFAKLTIQRTFSLFRKHVFMIGSTKS